MHTFEYQGETWDEELLEGLEDLQLSRQRAVNNPDYSAELDADVVSAKGHQPEESAEEEKLPRTRRKRSREPVEVVDDSAGEV